MRLHKPVFICVSTTTFLVLTLLNADLTAQLGGGSIVGVVLDPSGSVIVGAKVEANNVGTNVKNQTITNTEGYYEFPLLPVGRYVLSVEQQGFQKATTAEIALQAGTKPKIDFRMLVGEITTSVEVVAAAPLVNATTTELGVVINKDKVLELPLNGRSFLTLVGLQSGVVNTLAEPIRPGGSIGRGGVEFNGSHSWGNNYLLDGVDFSFGEINAVGDNAVGAGGTASVIQAVSVDAIEEFKTSSSAFSAEYGRAIGGVIAVTSKSGTNDFHGTMFEFFRNDALNANSFFSNRAGLKKPPLRHNQYGGNIGGPIVKDRAFFFFNYEGARLVRGTAITGNRLSDLGMSMITNPDLKRMYQTLSPKDCTPTSNPLVCFHQRNGARTNDEHTTLSKVDLNLGKSRLSGRFSWNHQDHERPQFDPDPKHQFVFPTRQKNLALQYSTPISATRFNEARFGWNHAQLDRKQTLIDDPAAIGSARAPGLTNIDGQCRIRFDTTTVTIADNFSVIRNRHTLKTGFEVRRLETKRIIAENPILNYNSIDDLIAQREPLSLQIWFGLPDEGYKQNQISVFFQDDFRINNRVQFNLGLRYEYYSKFAGPFNIAGTDPFGQYAKKGEPIFDTDPNNFAPRLGLVVDLTGKGRTILRSGFAISYQPPQAIQYYDMNFLKTSLVPSFAIFNVVDLPASLKPIRFPFSFQWQKDVLKAAEAADISALPQGLVLPRSIAQRDRADEYAILENVSLQHQLTDTLAVQASYTGTRNLKQFGNRQLNLINPATGRRQDPTIGQITLRTTEGRLWYHALQLAANQRLKRGLTFDAYYTWSRGMTYFGIDGGTIQDQNNFAGSVGPKVTDANHRFVLIPSYQFPTAGFAKDSALARGILGGWTLQAIINSRSGYPVDVLTGRDIVRNGLSAHRPDLVPGVDPYVKGPDRLVWLTRSAFDLTGATAQRRFGNLGFNALRGPSAFWMDMALHKNFQIREQHRLVFRWELFNPWNSLVLGQPSSSLADVNFGRVLSGNDGRSMQFALKYLF